MEELGRIRYKFIELLLDQDVIKLLRYLREMNVLNDEEKETVEGWITSEDRARCLIDTVMKKGERACSVMVDYLTEKPPELWPTLGLTPTSARIKLERIGPKLVYTLSDNDVINLLRYLREMNVLNDEEKKTVEGKTTREDKARCLIDTVLGKGEREISLMVDYLTAGQPELCSTLGLTPTSARIKLERIRSKLVDLLSCNDFINLLHYLRKMNVLNDEEKKTVEWKTNREDKARCLIDTVKEKGGKANSLMVDYLTEKHPELCSTLDPTKTAQIKLGRIGSKLFGMLSDHDVINLLHYLREMNVLNDEEKKTVERKTNREDKARCLIDTVLEKGERASSLMVDYLTKRQPELRIGFGGDPSFSSRQESPGLMSPSLPLEMHEGDSELGLVKDRSKSDKKKLSFSSGQGGRPGQISDKTVVKPRTKNKGELQRIHYEFVKTVKIAVIRGLLDDLLQQKVFSTEEKDSVMEKGKIKTDMARSLIDMVIGKGEKQSRIMIKNMKKRDPDLCSTLGLISSPAGVGQISDKTVVKPRTQNKGELQRIHYEFVKTVKIAVIRGLLDDLLQQKVFSTEEKDSVMEKGKIKTDMARSLIDMVIGKGEKQSRIMIESMKKRDPDLCSTLGLISSPAGVGQISDKTVVKPRTQNKGELQRIHYEFVKTVKIAVIRGLLDDLLQQKVFSTEDKDSVMEKKKIKTDMAKCLIDMVIGKGEKQSRIMIESMKKRDPDLCSTLGLISSPAGVGQISDKTVVKPRTQNKGKLQRIHSEFVKTVKIAVIRGLLDDLLQQKVFSTEDKDSVMEKKKIKTDMARCLIDMVIGKGEKQSRIMIESMKKRDPDLCSTLGLISSPAGVGQISDKTVVKPRTQNKGELQRIHSEFVKTVKIAVIRGLLDDLLQQKVFSTEDKDSVMEKKKIKTDMARCLIDMVIGKGEKQSRIMIESMKKRDPDLCSTLGLISSPAGVGQISDKTVVKPRTQNKGNGGLKRNGSKSEEVANKKPCTVDVSDSITETRSIGKTLTDKELNNVAKTLGNEWEQIAIHLQITTKALEDIKAEHKSVAMQKLKMLVMWKCRRPPGKATAQDLLEGLKDLEDVPAETRQLLTDLIKQ
ncbi:uncharacterized protein LOC130405537 isoform X2 [Gadus chalcogrammus]|uniref:uncharacterized protein LOC130405537 isoform X2 n=1 Tax=Gadus chalcogrammus TaxID=1042646 RepID=UPI0024C4A422|nr:uncharacterized protein LOC130405537 isoform X2 [Gadus chalcogrammus]